MKTPAGQDANATRVQPAQAGSDDPFGLAPWLKQVPDGALHPLMANPVAAMAATTAFGFSIAGQMAGAMLGMMQNAAERARVTLDETGEPAEKAKAARQEAEPAAAKPVLTVVAKAPEPAAEKTAVEATVKVAREKSVTPKTVEAKPVRKAPAVKTARADDLKVISGIGPKLEQVLNSMGIRRYADIAGLEAGDVAKIEAELGFSGRIARDGWVEQAKALAKGRG